MSVTFNMKNVCELNRSCHRRPRYLHKQRYPPRKEQANWTVVEIVFGGLAKF